MEKAKETLIVSWCDPGTTDSLFTSALSSFLMRATTQYPDIQAVGVNQVIGGQIARQRAETLANFEEMNGDWLLWIDSDIVINPNAFDLLWNNRDIEKRPVMCGVYFGTMEMNQTLPSPFPCIFKTIPEGNIPIHPLPNNELLQIDIAGLGFTLMHKSVAHKLRKKYGDTTFQITIDKEHISEDVSFFYKLKELKIPVYAHTGAIVNHVKRFIFDINYYNLWWNVVGPVREQQEKESVAKKDKE